ncbi:MAG: L-threonylcarbamoyladenylate synthase [Oligoflexia bacterium]|nr:L-threonylcarbamoyladenylate synthase [Oligoflexia bacterium]
MIEYIIPENVDDRIIDKASQLLSQGEVICFPTDTSWILAVDPFVKNSLEKLHKFKGEEKSKHYSLLCDSFSRASEVAVVPDSCYRLLRNKVPGHYTFIFEATKKLSKAVKASKTDKEVGLRFPPVDFVNRLITHHGQVLASTNITHEMMGIGDEEELYSYLIEERFGSRISMILDPGEYNFVGQSTIYQFTDNEIQLVRQGVGDLL